MKTWTEVPAGTLNAATQRFWVALGNNAETVANQINTKPGFVDKLARFAEEHCVSEPLNWDRAREIMGKNFFGVEEAVKHFGINPKGKLAGLCDIPWSEEVLESVKDTHILVAVFPLSILAMRAKRRRFFYLNSNYNKKLAFVRDKGQVGWHLVCKTPVGNSTDKNWDEQQELLADSSMTPTAQVLVYTAVGCFMATRERLFTELAVRTSSPGLHSDYHIHIEGICMDAGYMIEITDDSVWDESRFPTVALAAELKKP